MNRFAQLALAIAGAALLAAGLIWLGGKTSCAPPLTVAATFFAIGIGGVPALRTYKFTAWIIAIVTAAMLFPEWFKPFERGTTAHKTMLLVLIQMVMFGMATHMGIRDLVGVSQKPFPIVVGLFCQYLIMPLLGYSLAVLFRLPPEIAAGMVLIGSCSSGLASNVMVYIAGGNLALSIAITSIATLIAPVLTPMWMIQLAGSEVDVSFMKMMTDIIKIVIVPTGTALVHDYFKFGSTRGKRIVWGLAGAAVLLIADLVAHGALWNWAQNHSQFALWIELLAFILGGVLFGVLYHFVVLAAPWIDRWMPAAAMVGVVLVTGITTAEGRDSLLVVGLPLVGATVLHNLLGYLLAYWGSRACGLEEESCRTVAFEVGMQNGGMATGLAAGMNKLGTMGLAAAIFIPVMNVSGSLLANFWRLRPVKK